MATFNKSQIDNQIFNILKKNIFNHKDVIRADEFDGSSILFNILKKQNLISEEKDLESKDLKEKKERIFKSHKIKCAILKYKGIEPDELECLNSLVLEYLKYNASIPTINVSNILCINIKKKSDAYRYGFGIYDIDKEMLYYIFRNTIDSQPKFNEINIKKESHRLINTMIIKTSKIPELKQSISPENSKYIDLNDSLSVFLSLVYYFETNSEFKDFIIKPSYDNSYHKIINDLKYIVCDNCFFENNYYRIDLRSIRSLYKIIDEYYFKILILHFNLNFDNTKINKVDEVHQYHKTGDNYYLRYVDEVLSGHQPRVTPRYSILPSPSTFKSKLNENVGLFYISGHSGRNITQTQLDESSGPRMNIPEKCCYFTIVKTGTNLENYFTDIFNVGLTSQKNIDELKRIAFDPRPTSELLKEIENLEKNIYTHAFFEIYKNSSNRYMKEIKTYINDILNDILFYLDNTNVTNSQKKINANEFLDYMNKPVIDIVKYICHTVCGIPETHRSYYISMPTIKILEKYFNKLKVKNELINLNTKLIEPLEIYLNMKENEPKYQKIFQREYTYFSLFKTLNELKLRRYTGKDTITNYNITVNGNEEKDKKFLFGLLTAPYNISWNLELMGKKHKSIQNFILRHNILKNILLWLAKGYSLEEINKLFNSQSISEKKENNIFIISACNGILIDDKPLRERDTSSYKFKTEINRFPQRTEGLTRARRGSMSHMKQKYLKYKSKYLKLKRELF